MFHVSTSVKSVILYKSSITHTSKVIFTLLDWFIKFFRSGLSYFHSIKFDSTLITLRSGVSCCKGRSTRESTADRRSCKQEFLLQYSSVRYMEPSKPVPLHIHPNWFPWVWKCVQHFAHHSPDLESTVSSDIVTLVYPSRQVHPDSCKERTGKSCSSLEQNIYMRQFKK